MTILELIKLLSLASTSFIEEQHQTIYFTLTTIIILMSKEVISVNIENDWQKKENNFKHKEEEEFKFWPKLRDLFFILAILKLSRSWNQVNAIN